MIAALLPMAFVSGLMGPYMSPIPINASMGMLLSLAIAFIVTPWLSRLWMKPRTAPARGRARRRASARGSRRCSTRIFRPLLDERARRAQPRAARARASPALIALSLALPAAGLVRAQDAAVRQQVGVPGRRRHARRHAGRADRRGAARARRAIVARQPEVTDYQAYAGTAAPINFNGLVRQYYLRAGGDVGDLQVNLVDKHQRQRAEPRDRDARCARSCRRSARRFGANVKVVEVPPGPPVLSPIVAEVYGPEAEGRRQVAKAVRAVFERRRASSTSTTAASRRRRAAAAGRPPQGRAARRARSRTIVSTLRAGLAGERRDLPARREQVPGGGDCCSCRPSARATSMRCCSSRVRGAAGSSCRSASWSP